MVESFLKDVRSFLTHPVADPNISKSINENLSVNWENCMDKSYKSFTQQCVNVAKTLIPEKVRPVSKEPQSITKARSDVLNAPTSRQHTIKKRKQESTLS